MSLIRLSRHANQIMFGQRTLPIFRRYPGSYCYRWPSNWHNRYILSYEEVYLNHYGNVCALEGQLTRWFDYYHFRRRHSSLGYQHPVGVYLG